MLKFIRGKGQQPSAERQKLQRELFAFRKTVQHGFPNKPTCLAWDPMLRLMAIGTATGAIKIVGKPGVEFYGHHTSSDHHIVSLLFVPNEGRLVSLCDDNSLHLWEINDNSMEEVKAQTLEGKLKKISAIHLESSGRNLLLGTEGGNVYLLNIATFEFSENVIYQDKVVQTVEEDYKINPGAVEAIEEQPGQPDNVLIGYNRGLMVLWNRKTSTAEQTYVSTQQLESVCWEESGKRFISSHNDGSYAYWEAGSVGSKPLEEPSTPYGPFPCKAITKMLWKQDPNKPHEDILLFAGGMARASFSDRHTITALKGKHISEGKHIVFDFTSKVIDFFTVNASDEEEKGVIALVVLAEEELVAIDLVSEDWKMIGLPYLVSLHASAVTCSTYVSDVPEELWQNVTAVGKAQNSGLYSDAEWPVNGGSCNKESKEHRDILLTGHEDGSVRFWDAGGVALSPLYKFASSQALQGEDDVGGDGSVAATEEEDDWPPFRKVGSFDPYSDDPRLAVKKVSLCPSSGVLAVAGTAGHVVVAKLSLESNLKPVKVVTMNIVGDRDAFVWKGHERLSVRGGGTDPLQLNPGFQPISVLQLHPPAAVTSIALHSQWGLVAAGTAHGLAVFDYVRQSPVTTKCTLNPNDLSGAGDAPISRRKSFKKSLRESFRRLRKGRSTRHPEKRGISQSPSTPDNRKISESPSPSRLGSTPTTPIEAKPVERAVEARPVDDSLGSMVRCLAFARTFIISVQNMTPTLWAGSNNGTVYVFTIAIPGGTKRTEEPVSCQLGKEIQLKHRAPVIGINVIDSGSYPVDPNVKATEVNAPHRVIISSEEQIKIFTLPALKPFGKLKLTAAEGARVRRTAISRFHAGQHDEVCLLCLTNLGDTIVLSLPDLRRQINAAVIRREDINGISSLAFTNHGEGLYLHSSSELQRVTVSATRITLPSCRLELPPAARAQPNAAVANGGNDSSSSDSSSSSSSSDSSSSSSEDEAPDEEHKDPSSKALQQQEGGRLTNSNQAAVATNSNSNSEVAASAITENDKVVVVVENGVGGGNEQDHEQNEHEHDVSAVSSVGDITIDSVKDHLVNSSTISEENHNSSSNRVITTEISSSKLNESSTTTSETVTIKRTVTSNESSTAMVTPENS